MTSLKQIHESRGFRSINASFLRVVCFCAVVLDLCVLLLSNNMYTIHMYYMLQLPSLCSFHQSSNISVHKRFVSRIELWYIAIESHLTVYIMLCIVCTAKCMCM